jgi:hypothetical protein
MFKLPRDFAKGSMKLRQAMKCLGLKSATTNKILGGNKAANFKVAFWHYHPHHRTFSNGRWHLVKSQSYQDETGNEYPFAPPNYNLQLFIKNEISGVGWFDNRLPDWAPEFIAEAEKALKTRKRGLEDTLKEGTSTQRKRKSVEHQDVEEVAPSKRKKKSVQPEDNTDAGTTTVEDLTSLSKPQVAKKSKNKTRNKKVKELENQVSNLQSQLTELQSNLQQKEIQTADLESKLLRAKDIIENLMKAVREKEEVIERQKGDIDDLRDDKLTEQEEKLLEEVGRD